MARKPSNQRNNRFRKAASLEVFSNISDSTSAKRCSARKPRNDNGRAATLPAQPPFPLRYSAGTHSTNCLRSRKASREYVLIGRPERISRTALPVPNGTRSDGRGEG